jgi:hypothetical protein
LPHQGFGVALRQIDEIVTFVRADHDIGFGRIVADRPVTERFQPGKRKAPATGLLLSRRVLATNNHATATVG